MAGFQLLVVQLVAVIALAALCAGVLGWWFGRRRRASSVVADSQPIAASEGTLQAEDIDEPVGPSASDDALSLRVKELEETVANRERQLARLEAGATTAWDTTVPGLEEQINQLSNQNRELNSSLLELEQTLGDRESEIERLQRALKSQGETLLRPDGQR